METFVFLVAGAVVLIGAVGVVAARNPVHSALMLVMTLFGVAVLFIAQQADFLAVVQVIVYAGAIVVLFLFVIMLLGVDTADDLTTEPLSGQRPLAVVAGVGILGAVLVALFITQRDSDTVATGLHSVAGALSDGKANINQLAEVLFTDYLYAFEITSVLLVIAVVGAVVLARRPRRGEVSPVEPAEVSE